MDRSRVPEIYCSANGRAVNLFVAFDRIRLRLGMMEANFNLTPAGLEPSQRYDIVKRRQMGEFLIDQSHGPGQKRE